MKEPRQDRPKAPEAATPEVRPTRHRHKWAWIIGGILILIVLVVLLIPVALSSRGFTQWIQAKISSSTGGQADIGDLSVGWLKGVRVANFSFRGQNGWAAVDIDRITAQPSYGRLLSGTLAVNRAEVDQPRVAVDLRQKPPSTTTGPSIDLNELARVRDLVVRDGSVQVTDTGGQTAKITDLNSDVRMRPPGQTSRFNAAMVVAQAQGPAKVQAAGQVTPNKKTGWSLTGTSGDITVEVNDLNLNSVAPFLDMAGVQVQAQGQISANITGALQNGQIENLNATINGRNVDITGAALKGDRLQTSQLNVRASLAQAKDVIDVNQLDVRTDWATLSAAGTVPKTARSLTQLTASGSPYDLKGKFDVNLASLLSQMPNTIGVRKGTQITGGRATGSIDTITQAGRPVIVAKAQVAGLTGVVNDKKLDLTQPMTAVVQLSSDQQGAQLQGLNVSTPFAQVNASGSFKQIKYDGQVDLKAFQSELGSFVNLGSYAMTGQVTSKGQVSIGDQATDITGTLSTRQLVVASPDGNSISEPQATANFALGIDRKNQVVAVDTLTADTSLASISIKKAQIPFGQKSPAPMNLNVLLNRLDLSRLKPYALLFATFPKQLTLGGIAQSQVNVTSEKGIYHISSTGTQIQNLQVISAGKEPFRQNPVTATFDVYIDPAQKTINRASWQVKSPQITIKGQLTQTSQASTTKAQGAVDAQVDWAAVSPLVAGFVPGQLSLVGQRQVSLNFTSTYPANEPNLLLANLNGKTAFGFDQARYMGLDFGPTEVNIQVQNGLMQIQPFSTAVNNGKLNFAGQADLRKTPAILTIAAPQHLVQAVQINTETTERLLKYVNPVFANAVNVTGIANFDLEQLAVPLTSGGAAKPEVTGTLWIDKLELGASNILNDILKVGGQSLRGEVLTVHPTNLVLRNGVVQYSDMQIDVGNNPINFRGSVGPNGVLNLSVVLPYTLEGRTVRVGQEQGAGQRIVVPLTGTVTKPQLNLQELVKSQLQQQIQKGLEELFKKRSP